MEQDQRREPRISLTSAPEGDLRLHQHDTPLDVPEIMDVSPFGIGLVVFGDVPTGSVVQLHYSCERGDFEVEGSVVWSRATEDGSGSRIGIYLDPALAANNVDLFNALTASDD